MIRPLITGLLVLTLLSLCLTVLADTHYGWDDFPGVSAALDGNVDSDTIFVWDGTYGGTDSAMITISVTIISPLTQIELASPADRSTIVSPPTFMWTADGGSYNGYNLDLHAGRKKWSTRTPETIWTMPNAMWDNLKTGKPVHWRVRGVDLDQRPPTVITSDEKWSFLKQ